MTNKTDKNSNVIRAVAQSQTEQASSDTNPTWKVAISLAEYSSAVVIVQAPSACEAKRKVFEIPTGKIDGWTQCNRTVSIESIREITGGHIHD